MNNTRSYWFMKVFYVERDSHPDQVEYFVRCIIFHKHCVFALRVAKDGKWTFQGRPYKFFERHPNHLYTFTVGKYQLWF